MNTNTTNTTNNFNLMNTTHAAWMNDMLNIIKINCMGIDTDENGNAVIYTRNSDHMQKIQEVMRLFGENYKVEEWDEVHKVSLMYNDIAECIRWKTNFPFEMYEKAVNGMMKDKPAEPSDEVGQTVYALESNSWATEVIHKGTSFYYCDTNLAYFIKENFGDQCPNLDPERLPYFAIEGAFNRLLKRIDPKYEVLQIYRTTWWRWNELIWVIETNIPLEYCYDKYVLKFYNQQREYPIKHVYEADDCIPYYED